MAITDVFKKAFDRKKQEQLTAAEEYRDLLHRYANVGGDKWKDADEKRLFQLIDILNISEEQANADAATVNAMVNASKLASGIPDAVKAYDKANASHSKTLEERQRMHAEMNAKVNASTLVYEDALEHMNRSYKARGELDRLRESHPHLANDSLGGVPTNSANPANAAGRLVEDNTKEK